MFGDVRFFLYLMGYSLFIFIMGFNYNRIVFRIVVFGCVCSYGNVV